MSGDLKPGDQLQQRDGHTATITKIRHYAADTTVYNFEVEGDHNYYISEAQVLVHNCPAAGGAAGNDPPLRLLHPSESLSASSLDYWSRQSTADITRSLAPGQPESLLVKPDGTVMNGNTLLTILRERGYDINQLPREIYVP